MSIFKKQKTNTLKVYNEQKIIIPYYLTIDFTCYYLYQKQIDFHNINTILFGYYKQDGINSINDIILILNENPIVLTNTFYTIYCLKDFCSNILNISIDEIKNRIIKDIKIMEINEEKLKLKDYKSPNTIYPLINKSYEKSNWIMKVIIK